MRRPYPSFKHRHRAICCAPLRLERLELRLALSHGSLAVPYDWAAASPLDLPSNSQVAQVANVAIFGPYNARLSPLESGDFGRLGGGSVDFGGGASDVLRNDVTSDFRSSERQISIAPSLATDEAIGLLVLVHEIFSSLPPSEIPTAIPDRSPAIPPPSITISNNSVSTSIEVYVGETLGNLQGPQVHVAVTQETEAIPPPSVTPYIDPRPTRPNEPSRAGNADVEQHYQSAPVVALSAESLNRASQTTGAGGGENRMPAFVPPILAPHVALSTTPPGNTGSGGGPLGLAPVPQAGLDAIEAPSSRALKSDPNLGASSGSSSAPHGGAEQPGTDSTAAINLASGSRALGGPIGGEVADAMSAGNRAALLASLPFNMEAVDQALAVMMNEIEGLGGEFVSWLDDASVPPWAVAATFAEACGLAAYHFWRTRGRRSAQEESEEESSSWLFTRLQSPAGHL
jgi:hypothetical protein